MFLQDCERIPHNNKLHIFGLPSQDCLRNSSFRDTGFSKTTLDPSFMRVNFSSLEEYGDIPPSHGDVPMVFNQIYELAILFQRVKERLFRILPNGSIINGYFKYGRCKYAYLYGFLIPDSLSMRNTFSLTFRNEMIIFSFYQQFQVSINRHYCTIHRTNDFQNELWLATFDSSGNASEMISFTIPQSVTISEQRFGGQETLNHQSEGLPFR